MRHTKYYTPRQAPPEQAPWERDLRTYSVGAVFMVLAVVVVAFLGGYALKVHHKARPVVVGVSDGCYRWTDGHVQCRREP